ncbi:MAG: peptidylprolyl isomerase [Bryobacteraceae bacterium]|nr:peptidylprolyl isomerase [Bryobacteraceae bacterium]
MFDLFRSREKNVRYLMGALLMLVALSMVITLVPGYGTGGSPNNPVLASIGKEEITLREAQLNLSAAMRDARIPPEIAEHYVPMYVQGMVSERALAHYARELGMEVTEEEVSRTIRILIPQLFDQSGNFVGRDVYAQFLAQQNLTINQFEENVKRQLLLKKLEDLVVEGAVVSRSDVERQFRREQEKVKLAWVALNPQKYRSQVTVTPEEVKASFDKTRATYITPEKRSFTALSLDEESVAASLRLDDNELRRAYDAQKERFRTPERVKVRHILLKTTEKPKDEIPKIRAKAEDLLKQIRGGADFAELAKKNSEDTVSAANGGSMDWITRGQTVANFEKTSFTLKPKEISSVIETEYGFHIVQLLEKEEARLRPFEEVKADLAKERQQQAVIERLQSTADQAREALVKAPMNAEAIARQYGLKLSKADRVERGGVIPEVGVAPELSEAIFSAQRGAVTPVAQVAGNKLAFAVVTDVQASRPAEFADVEAQVRDRLLEEKAGQLAQQKIAEFQGRLKAAGNDLEKVAKEMGLEVKTTSPFTRAGTPEGIGSASYVADAFTKEIGGIVGPITIPGGSLFAKVVEKIPPDMTLMAAETAKIQQSLKQEKVRERKDLLSDSVVSRLTKSGKVKINQDVMNRLVSAYRRG